MPADKAIRVVAPTTELDPSPALAPARRVAPFDSSVAIDEEASFDVNPFTPRRTPAADPAPSVGIDLSGRNKVIFAAGRGKTGKTTFLRWVAEKAIEEGRPLLMADIDPTNASFSSYFEDVSRPDTDDPAGVNRWLQSFIEYAAKQQISAVIDMGGGDTTLRTLATEMPSFAQQIEEAGLIPVNFYLAGAQPDDMAPIATMASRGYRPRARAIVLNESTGDVGLSRDQAFGRIVRNRVFLDEMKTGAINLWMPRLHAADAVESRRSSYALARDGQTTPPLGIFDRSRVRAWLGAMDKAFEGVRSWMP